MYVIGTAGHVDHGKSTLVEALTGIDPDRLQEEKERGLTIDLGFAWMTLPNGPEVSIVDVPGHERFVNNMLAGVGGIDLALLVVAADESVMPQTREHLAILDLLRIERGLVAVTKRDLVDSDWLELVMADIEEVLEGTSLSGSPIVPVSGTTHEGLPELVAGVQNMLQGTEPKKDLGRPRLPIDRSFTMSGFGTVVTGTLVDGRLDVGQEVELAISGTRTRVRGLQTHRYKVDSIGPGNRVATNLSGVEHESILRGEVLTTPGWLRPTMAMDVHLRMVPDAPRAARHNMFTSIHIGSNEVVGRLRLLDKDRVAPGDTAWAQLKLESPLAVVKGDYFVLRSGGSTLGGGNVVDVHARRHRRNYSPLIERLQAMEAGSEQDVLLKTIETAEPSALESLVNRANLLAGAAKEELAAMAAERLVVALGPSEIGNGSLLYTAGGWSAVSQRARDAIAAYHKQFPLRIGAPREELRNRLGMSPQVAGLALPRLVEDGMMAETGTLVRLPTHEPSLSPEQERDVDRYLKELDANPYSPSTESTPDPEVIALLDQQGKVVKVSDGVVFSARAYEAMVEIVRERIREHGDITVGDARDMFGTSRKYVLALLDYLDQQRITRRVGDSRVLR